MSKGIIIDGVNVAECEFFTGSKKHLCTCQNATDNIEISRMNFKCSNNPNCNYKQLQREKQKNEELGKALQEARKCLIISENSKDIQHEQWFTRCTEISKYRSIWKEYATIQFKVKKALKRVLNARKQKINKIDVDEYNQICEELDKALSFGECDWCS